MKIISTITIILCAAVSWAGVNTASFLNVGVGARAMAMGGAFTAIADDASAVYWNPAGLNRIKKISLSTMIQQIGSVDDPSLKDIAPDYQFVSVVLPLAKCLVPDSGTVGIGFISNSLDNIPYTTRSADGSVLRQEVSDQENAYFVSYGRPVVYEGLSLGIAFKFVNQKISAIPDGSAQGCGFDAGMYYWFDDNIRFGFVTQSGVAMGWDNGHTDYGSLRNKAGIGYRIFTLNKYSLLSSLDIIQMRNYPLEAHIGFEADYYCALYAGQFILSKMSLRTGINGIALDDRYNMQGRMNENLNWTVGAGFEMRIMKTACMLDYALGATPLGDRHRISLSFSF